jgi:hypothetical protein
MSHPLYDVVDFEIIGDYRLRVVFDDRVEQEIDFHPVLFGEMYGPLRDLRLFNQVRLDREVATLVWPNGADFDPWMLHEWPHLIDELTKRARQWELVLA